MEKEFEKVKGVFMYQGIHTTSQVDYIKEYFENFLVQEKFDLIIEIGTALAGLTYILDDIRKENKLNCIIETFDIAEHSFVKNYLLERNINYNIIDEFTDEFKSIIINFINSYKKVLLLCDGGNKIDEFNKYSKYIKPGDFIMAHDYSKNKQFFEEHINNKVWNWCEITYNDISNSVESYNLINYEKINFQDVVWGCFYKTSSQNTIKIDNQLEKVISNNESEFVNGSIKELMFLKELLDKNLISNQEFLKLKEKIIQ
jgi:cephalosporin hydroxylase